MEFNSPTWITLQYGNDEEYLRLNTVIEELGYPLIKNLKHIPYDPILPINSCVVVNGPVYLVRDALRWQPWNPIAYLDLETFSCRHYYGKIRKKEFFALHCN